MTNTEVVQLNSFVQSLPKMEQKDSQRGLLCQK